MDLKCIYGYMAGMTTSVFLQPLDNIKMTLILPPKDVQLNSNFFGNVSSVICYLKNQGCTAFYRALVPNALKNSLASSIYFTFLRQCESISKKYSASSSSAEGAVQKSAKDSFMFSCLGRSLASTLTNPINIVETRFSTAGQNRWSGNVLSALWKLYQKQGLRGCLKGSLANCYKEGIFAGIFYVLYNQGKSLNINDSVSGMVAGFIATATSHPLEILRAKLQSSNAMAQAVKANRNGNGSTQTIYQVSLSDQLLELIRKNQLFKGAGPRLIKKPLANTITFLMFEAMESSEAQKQVEDV